MGKNKYRRFQENLSFGNLVQPSFEEAFHTDHYLKGRWREDFFGNGNPIVLELGCGRGEYTVALAAADPGKNFIGIDIKGARMWRGAKTATEAGLKNAGFLRTRIEFIDSFFAPCEVDEIWITFPDPQPKKQRVKKRLTSPLFLERYAKFIRPDAPLHLKTDSVLMHDYTKAVALSNGFNIEACNSDIYGIGMVGTMGGGAKDAADRASADGDTAGDKTNKTAGSAAHTATTGIFGEISEDILSIKTAYESRFLGEGRAITYLRFSLDGCKSFAEPDFEEEHYYPGEARER